MKIDEWEEELIISNINDFLKVNKCPSQTNFIISKKENYGYGIIMTKSRRNNIQSVPRQKKKLTNINNNEGILINLENENIENKNLENKSKEALYKPNINENINYDEKRERNNISATKGKNANQLNANSSTSNIDPGKELLKAFIYIYYYEKSLKEKNIFLNSSEKYYLINPIWFTKFKNFYSYDNIQEILKSNEEINFYNIIDFNIDNIIDIVFEKIKLNKKSLPNDIKNPNTNITCSQKNENIKFIKNGIILPSKIFDIIKKVHSEFKFYEKKNLIFKDNYIYYINKEKIIVGLFMKNSSLIPCYVCTYKSIDLEKFEENKMISLNINEYLKQRNCNIQIEYQMLKNEQGEEIGSLIINHQNIQKISKNIQNFPPKNKNQFNNRNRNNNNEKLKSQTTDEEKNLIKSEGLQKQKENELINNNNNLNIQIKNLEQQLLNNNIEYEKLKKEYNLVLLSQKNDKHQIENLKNEIFQIKKKEKNIIKDFSELDNKYKNLNKSYKQLLEENKNFKIQNSIINEEKENLIDKLKQNEAQISNQKDIINQVDNFNNLINKLNQELEKKNEDNIIINNELVKIKSEKNALTVLNNEKEKELNNLKIEISKLKLNEINLLSIKSNMQSLQKKADNFNDLEKEKNNISQKYNQLIEKNKALENKILQLNEEIKKLSEKIGQYEKQISNQQDKLNKI